MHWADYLLFSLSLAVPLAIGIFFFLYGGRQRTTNEYLLGDKGMNGVVVGFSIMVSYFSAITLISAPAETYYYGAIWTLTAIPFIFNIFLNCLYFVPFFRRFSYISGYQYFENRYQSQVIRFVVAFFYILMRIFTMGTAIYAPAVVFNQVTGVSVDAAIIVCGIVCVAYTFLGGLKAVLYTDSVQAVLMLGGYVALVILGTRQAGGINTVWQDAQDGGRFNFDTFSTDLRVRHTNLNLLLGSFISNWGFYDQVTLQRIAAARSISAVYVGMFVSVVVGVLNTVMVTLAGLLIYSAYKDCDPLLLHSDVEEADQIVAHFALEIFEDYPGLAGLFLASLFAAALSTISSMMNALSLTVVEDYVKPSYLKFRKEKISDRKTLYWAKGLSLVFGAVAIGFSYVAPLMSPLLLTSSSIIGASIGSPIAALFILSIFFPWTNVVGALAGFLSGLFVGIGLAVIGMVHSIDPPILPIGYCGLNITHPSPDIYEDGDVLQFIADISYLWYGAFAMSTTLIVGVLVTLLTQCTRFKQDISYLFQHGLLIYRTAEPVEMESTISNGDILTSSTSKPQIESTYL